jgi:hypothetical protein
MCRKAHGTAFRRRFDFDRSAYELPLGCLDDDPGKTPRRHVFVACKAPRHDITDDLPQFPELPK